MNLKEILKIPGVWDPFIISYVEVCHHSHLFCLVKELFEPKIMLTNKLTGTRVNTPTYLFNDCSGLEKTSLFLFKCSVIV